jgi:PAS domain S-box-containing protein
VVSTTLDGHITSWNRGAAQTYGRSAEQVIGRPFTSLEGRQPMADALLRAIPLVLKNGMHEFESRLADADGRETIIQSRLSLLRDERQNPVGIINHSIDITTRRQLETKLQQAQKLESLGVLAGGVAHDFNNLLMGVLGHAELALLSMPPGAPGRQSLEHIRTAALRAADLCRQMLAYSGKGRFIVQPIDLARMVEEMTHLLEVPISKKATLRYEFAPYLPAFEADPTQIRQVVMNLITNAAEAIEGDDGEIVVRTSVAEVDAARPDHDWLPEALLPGRYVSLEVSDNGCGMDAETKRKIFDPFFSTKFTGRGLGLAAVIGIVRGHHGGLQVRSEKGCGTTFRILFPCSTTQATSAPSEPAVANGWSGAGTVLVADDDPEVRLVVSELLERLGFKFLLACDGVEAVEVFRREADRLRLVLLDLTMPRLDGNQALKQMAEIRSEIPVVVISGYSEQDTVLRISGRQLAGFIQKPFQSSALISKLREVLDSHPLTNPNSD